LPDFSTNRSLFLAPIGQFDTTRELELHSLFRRLPSTWQNWLLQRARIHVKAYQKVEPDELAGNPERFYRSLAFEELDAARTIRGLPDHYATEEEFEQGRQFYYRHRAWRQTFDKQDAADPVRTILAEMS
jgi:hypothetical protein